jgi:hypothetical protein
MHIAFALFADAANLSQEGKLNILGVFDALHVGSLPAVHPRATLVLRLKGGRADVGTHGLRLEWRNPAGADLWSSDGELNVTALPPGVTEMDMPIIAALDLPIDQAGEYTLRVAIDDDVKVAVPLQVRAADQPMRPIVGGLVS